MSKQVDIKLSKNFMQSEFADKSTGTSLVDIRLVSALQELRDNIKKSITISSGYRSPAHNTAVGGTAGSLHCLGRAADIKVAGMDLLDLLTEVGKIEAFNRSGIGFYGTEGFIHVDIGREKPARWARVGGAYVGLAAGIKSYNDRMKK